MFPHASLVECGGLLLVFLPACLLLLFVEVVQAPLLTNQTQQTRGGNVDLALSHYIFHTVCIVVVGSVSCVSVDTN